MAPKNKSRLVDQPPSASSSEEQEQVEESQEEQEEESGEEESEEESEEEEPKTVEKKPQTTQKPVQTPTKPQSSSSSETQNGSGSESESESESGQSQPSPSASAFTVKPSLPPKATPTKPSTKRPQETQKDSKRTKKPKIQEEEEKKSATTPIRLWSDEDQIAVLKGMVEFKNQKGTEPNSDMSAFHDFVKGKLQVEVSKSQLSDKLRRLKKKYLTNVKDGEEPVFFKPNDNLVFEYSKKIWGGGKSDNAGTSNGVIKENVKNNTDGKAKKAEKAVEVKKSAETKKSAKVSNFKKPKDDEKHKEEEKGKQVAVKEVVMEDNVEKGGVGQDFQSKYPRLAASIDSMADLSLRYPSAANMLKENMSLLASDKAKVLEEKWKKLEEDEAELMVKRLDLISEHYKMVVDAMKGN